MLGPFLKRLGAWLVATVALAMLAGCNGMPTPSMGKAAGFAIHSGLPIPYLFAATAIQWNEEYAVTVDHIPYVSGTVYHCSRGCDLIFFRHKAKGVLPRWRDFRPGERVTAVGTSPLLVPVEGAGRALQTRIKVTDEASDVLYAAHDAPVAQGMSGGPVYGEDGWVVGMTIGFIRDYQAVQSDEVRAAERLSVYLPYAEIREEWERYQDRARAAN